VIVLLLTISYGIVGVAAGGVTLYICLSLLRQEIANRLIHLSKKEFFQSIYVATVSSTLMAAAVYFLKQAVRRYYQLDNFYILLGLIVFGVIVYVVAVILTHKKLLVDLNDIIENVRKRD
jgi:hypothetical protein